jgi:hypothetical protein
VPQLATIRSEIARYPLGDFLGKRLDTDQLGYNQQVVPVGLLNPDKMRSFVERATG